MEDGNRAASGGMSNGEIEDVLDSIRRLVAQSSSAVAVGAPRGRLILTPAFRVDQNPVADASRGAGPVLSAIAPIATQRGGAAPCLDDLDPDCSPGGAESDPDGDPAVGAGTTRAWPGEEESPADIAARRDEIASRTAAEAATLDALRRVVARDSSAVRAETPSPDLASSDDEAMWGEAAPGRASDDANGPASRTAGLATPEEDPTEALERTIAELEAAIAASAEDWDPDGSEHGDLMDLSSPIGSATDSGIAGFDDRADRSTGDDLQVAGELPHHLGDLVSGHDATAASDPTAGVVAPDSAGPESAGPESAGPADPHAMAIEPDSPEARDDRIGEQATIAVDAEEWSDDLAAADVEAVIDEDMLRDLVARIVREELQGRLGERITRNVRKLVRAEIARALAERPYG